MRFHITIKTALKVAIAGIALLALNGCVEKEDARDRYVNMSCLELATNIERIQERLEKLDVEGFASDIEYLTADDDERFDADIDDSAVDISEDRAKEELRLLQEIYYYRGCQ